MKSNRMREYYVDTHPTLLDHISGDDKNYRGNLSVRQRQDEIPLLMIGQDASTFHHFQLSKR